MRPWHERFLTARFGLNVLIFHEAFHFLHYATIKIFGLKIFQVFATNATFENFPKAPSQRLTMYCTQLLSENNKTKWSWWKKMGYAHFLIFSLAVGVICLVSDRGAVMAYCILPFLN